ncbi:AMP-binding protein, partial [Caulobacter sp. HMWF009]
MFGLTEMLNSAARGGPNSPSTTFNTTTRTWSQTQARVARLAGGLGAMGVQRGDRVAILALNSDRYTEFLSAVWWAGAVVVPMNIRWTAEENAYSLRDSGTRVLFVDRAFASVAAACRAMCPDLEQVVWSDDGPAPEGLRHYEDLITAHDPAPDAGAGGEDLAGLYYTGGTTGFPKGVMLPHRALWYNNLVCAMLL